MNSNKCAHSLVQCARQNGRVETREKGEFLVARPRYQHGYLFQRVNNWVLRYRESVVNSDGSLGHRHRSVVLGEYGTKREAKRAADAYLRPFNQRAYQPQADMTLADFWLHYFEPEILPTLKVSTRKLYRCLAGKHLLPHFGEQKISDIARVQVQQFIGIKQRQGYATETLGHLRDLLSKVLSTAISWGWLQDNPARGAKLPPMNAGAKLECSRRTKSVNWRGACLSPRALFSLWGSPRVCTSGNCSACRSQMWTCLAGTRSGTRLAPGREIWVLPYRFCSRSWATRVRRQR